MELIKELLGFMVLSGPLIIIVPWLILSIWISRKVVKRIERPGAKRATGIGIFLLVFLVPFADEIAGRIYLSHLCATQASVKVYKTVELPAEYWDEQGKPRFIKENGDLDQSLFGERFEWHSIRQPYLSSLFLKVDAGHWQLAVRDTQEILGERITFHWLGGWLEDFSPAPTRGASCPLLSEQYSGDEYIRRQYEREQGFYSKVFHPATSSK